MARGFLYILLNPNMPGLIKVGKTVRDPSDRAKELSSATGVPTPFVLVYSQPVDDCDAAEAWAHSELERRGYRPNSDREFFAAPVHEAVGILHASRIVAGAERNDLVAADLNPAMDSDALADELFQLALSYLYGTDSILANPQKALAQLEQAAALGHAEAASIAGTLYRWGKETVEQDLEKSLEYHKKAVAKGVWSSLASIADIFEVADQPTAAEKHWALYFDSAVNAYLAADDAKRFEISKSVGMYGSRYWLAVSAGSIRESVPVETLAVFRNDLIDFQEKEMTKEMDYGAYQARWNALSFLRAQISPSHLLQRDE